MDDADVPPGKVSIALNGNFGAEELDTILSELAKARASLIPPIPMEPPSMLGELDILVQEETLFRIRRRVGGGLRIWLRSSGFGWQAFDLSAAAAAELRTYLASEIRAPGTPH